VYTGFWLGGQKLRDHWKDIGVGVGGKIILGWTLGSRDRWDELDSAGSG